MAERKANAVFVHRSRSANKWQFVGQCQTPVDIEKLCNQAVEDLTNRDWVIAIAIALVRDWPVEIIGELPAVPQFVQSSMLVYLKS